MDYYNLTNPQKSIWLMEEYYKGTNINNICGTLTIKQDVDLDILSKSINIFIKNNNSFSLNLKYENGNVVQYFSNNTNDLVFETVYLKNYDEVRSLAKKTSEYVFDIHAEQLFKFILYKLENGYGGFIILTHHIISDAATFGMIGTEIVDIYKKLLDGENTCEKSFSYKDYIQDEKEYMNSSKFVKDEEYWNNLYSDIPEIAMVPSMLSNNSASFVGKAERKNFLIGKELIDQISDFCKKNKISNFNFFMAILAIYLHKVTSLNDFAIGTPILNRSNFREKHTTGMFINTAALRIDLKKDLDFISFVKQIASSSLSMLRYQKYPYELLLENLRKGGNDLSGLFDFMISYQITKANDKNISIPYEVEWLPTSTIAHSMCVHLHDNNDEGTLNISYDYQIQKYEEKDIQNMHNRILYIISQVLENENILEKDIEIVTEDEKIQILYEFNDTDIPYAFPNSIIEMIEKSSEKFPHHIAIEQDDLSISYEELIFRINKLCNYLLRQGIKENNNIGIFTTRTIDTIVRYTYYFKIKLYICTNRP